MQLDNFTNDFHVHCGQYYENYYQPATIIKCLHNNGIKNAWISSTTSCVEWSNKEEKEYLINHINEEINEATYTANRLGLNLTPLYWVVPQRHIEGESIENVIKGSLYKGFKIHTRIGMWTYDNSFTQELFEEVCLCAQKYDFPILIHTGVDVVDSPKRFEKYFLKYKSIKFVLAHCNNYNCVIEVFKNCENVCGDTAFCSKENYDKICKKGFKNRMLIGTDFPINFVGDKSNHQDLTEKSLTSFYSKEKNKMGKWLFK